MKAIAWSVILSALACHAFSAGDRVDPGTLHGKLIMGYQGWFDCPNDGANLGWGHWVAAGGAPAIDMLPDTRDLPPPERCPSPIRSADGRAVALFSNLDIATVETHFGWMQQYGLDGVALQRYATGLLVPQVLEARNRTLQNVRRAAEDHGRVFFIMYDLSGLAPADLPAVTEDWQRLEREGITRSSAYLHHRGHPLLGIWGLGFGGRPVTPHEAEDLVDALDRLSAPYGGVTLLGGVPSYWRTRTGDASDNPGWFRVWRRLGVLSPWSVGRFVDDAGADAYRRDVLEPDLQATHALGVDYLPVVFPGYSRANAARAEGSPGKPAINAIPRRCGRFFWRQVYNALSAGASMLYGAMFDEVNEGTAMFKLLPHAVNKTPQGGSSRYSYVTLDADGCQLPSNWYLRLAGATAATLHGGGRSPVNLPLPLPSP